MKIMPLEIRQRTFEKALRGYDKDEVNAFLQTLSHEWERLLEETRMLKKKVESSEQEISKMKEMEHSLFQTLRTAESTGSNIMEQASKSAELMMKETRLKADAYVYEAKQKANAVAEQAEALSKSTLRDMEEKLKQISQQYKALEFYRENLIGDIKRMATELIERVDKMESSGFSFNLDEYLANVKKESKKTLFPNEKEGPAMLAVVERTETATAEAKKPVFPVETRKTTLREAAERSRSFFDTIE